MLEGDESMLDDRKKKILQAVIDEYINSAEPVSSSTLVEKYGLCGGYTDSMMLFLERFKIPNYKIATENHIWNYVEINNDWLHLDLTWDDPISTNVKPMLDDAFFLIDDDELQSKEKEQHSYNADIYAQ